MTKQDYVELYELTHTDANSKQTTLFVGTESECEDWLDHNVSDEQFNDTSNNYYHIHRKYD